MSGRQMPPRTLVRVLAAVFIAMNLAAAGFEMAQAYLEFGLIALIAIVGVAFALCAVRAEGLGAPALPVWLMLAASFGQSLTGLWQLTETWNPLWPMLWAAATLPQTATVLLALSYPTGRFTGAMVRLVAAAAIFAFVVNAAVRLFTYDPGTWGWRDVPANVFAFAADPSFPIAVVYLYGELIVSVLALVTVTVRWVRGSRPWRAVNALLTGAFALLALSWISFDVFYLFFDTEVDNSAVQYLTYVTTGAVPVIYVASLVRQRASRARVADLILAARSGINRAHWQGLIIDALDDDSATLLWWDHGAGLLRTAEGAAVPDPRGDPSSDGTATVTIGEEDHPLAVLVHDPAVSARPELIASVGEAVRLAVANEHLTAELSRTLEEVRASRARLVGAGDAARRAIERDLHDGVQQLLVSAAMNLALVRDGLADVADPELAAALANVSHQLSLASTELRRTVHGIAPMAISHGGVSAALEELALRASIPVSVKVTGNHEPALREQTTVYYVVAECLTNVAKHAGAARAHVAVDLGDSVRVIVSDDGSGGADPQRGTGLRGIADRIEATGGTIHIESHPGRGTRVEAVLPPTKMVLL